MIQRSQKAGFHTDKKKERDKYLARQTIEEEEMEEPYHERELPHICVYPYCYEEAEYVSPADLCKSHWLCWWNDGLYERREHFWKELLGEDDENHI